MSTGLIRNRQVKEEVSSIHTVESTITNLKDFYLRLTLLLLRYWKTFMIVDCWKIPL